MLDAKLLITQYADAFFNLNPTTKQNMDVIKLVHDEKNLHQKYLEGKVNLDELYFKGSPLFEKAYQVQKFINYQKSLRTKDKSITPLMKVVSRIFPLGSIPEIELLASEKLVKALLMIGSDINTTDFHGRTALMYVVLGESMFKDRSIIRGRERFASLLLNHGADPNIKDYLGNTALDYFKEYAGVDHPSVKLLEEVSQKPRTGIRM